MYTYTHIYIYIHTHMYRKTCATCRKCSPTCMLAWIDGCIDRYTYIQTQYTHTNTHIPVQTAVTEPLPASKNLKDSDDSAPRSVSI